ncbi:SycD/LcrH family type III secretion system chaperone [Shewanella surugensis]|uniref:SycD/LcrH family type III secretion system chaperone n=1 Tax=Shewanella surugensis TaxID=212020 RepID=A0ABT0L7N4_9GAMM|nr:SycD/LcrH family type III secretion system chaperone [Shewanella surugensis]MCL1123698.1 SycD/LcrH family type III secretion system chaperone [Shewanella surugensis]
MKQEEFDTLQQFLKRGGSLSMLADTSPQDLSTLYQYALQLMACHDFEAAKRIFYLLMRLDHWSHDYNFNLGLCYQQTGAHEEAIFCFGRAGTIKVDTPYPAYQAALSYIKLGNHTVARNALDAALIWCHNHAHYADIKKDVEVQLANVKGATQ